MNSPQYRVFVCTKRRESGHPEGCCHQCGATDVYRALQSEIQRHRLDARVELRASGCLDRCEAGVVALVCPVKRNVPGWLPAKVQRKWISKFAPDKFWYGHLTAADIPSLVESHFVNGQPLNQRQI